MSGSPASLRMGSFKTHARKISSESGLDFSNYILHVGQRLRMDLPAEKKEYLELKGLVTYDKKVMEQDLLRGVRSTTDKGVCLILNC